MPSRLPRALALMSIALLAACTGAAAPSPSAAPSTAACDIQNPPTKTPDKLTVGADNPAFSPYFEPMDGGNTEPWDPEQGDPNSGKGFESAVAYAVAEKLGFAREDVTWIPLPFANSFAPGPKEFDVYLSQVSYSPEREQNVDLSDGYYFGNQAVVVADDSELADATTISELKEARFGAQTATTSFRAIEEVIEPTAGASVYDSNDAAIEALQAGQIDAIVVDLPTAFYITNVQAEDTAVIGQIGPEVGAEQEYFSLVLEKDSPLTDCVNEAIRVLAEDGTLDSLVAEWLPDDTVPVLEP